MGIPAYTSRFAQFHALTTESFVIPPGYIWVLNTIGVFYPGGSVAPGFQIVNADTTATLAWDSAPLSAVGLWRQWAGLRLVMEPGEIYEVSALGEPDLTLCGYALTIS